METLIVVSLIVSQISHWQRVSFRPVSYEFDIVYQSSQSALKFYNDFWLEVAQTKITESDLKKMFNDYNVTFIEIRPWYMSLSVGLSSLIKCVIGGELSGDLLDVVVELLC